MGDAAGAGVESHGGDVQVADGGRVAEGVAGVDDAAHQTPGDPHRIGAGNAGGGITSEVDRVIPVVGAFGKRLAGKAGAGEESAPVVNVAGAGDVNVRRASEVVGRQHGVAGGKGVVVHGEHGHGEIPS